MAAAPIYNPVIPCVHPIPGGMFPGRMIRFQGTVPPGAQRFAINLQCGPNTDPRDDIALHLNFRFIEMCVVRNHLTAMSWGMEETSGGMPLSRGDSFEALVLCEPQSLKVALNGAHFCEFPHRLPFQRISHFTVDGDVMMQFVGFEGAQPPPTQQMYMSEPPAYGAYGAPPPSYGAPGYGAPQGYATAVPAGYDASQYAPQQRRGLGTGAAVGLGVGALAAGGLAGYALGGGFRSDSPPPEPVQASGLSPDFGGSEYGLAGHTLGGDSPPPDTASPRGDSPPTDTACPRGDSPQPDTVCPRGDSTPPDTVCPRGDSTPPETVYPRGDSPSPDTVCPRGDSPPPETVCPREDSPPPEPVQVAEFSDFGGDDWIE